MINKTSYDEISDKTIELTKLYDGCPPAQAIINAVIVMYLSGEQGLIYLTLLAANMWELLDRLDNDD